MDPYVLKMLDCKPEHSYGLNIGIRIYARIKYDLKKKFF